jgi:hypothetical protein
VNQCLIFATSVFGGLCYTLACFGNFAASLAPGAAFAAAQTVNPLADAEISLRISNIEPPTDRQLPFYQRG